MSQDDLFVINAILKDRREVDYPDTAPDAFFEIFAAQQVLKKCRHNLDPDEIEAGIVGGHLDGGVDAFYLFANERLVREDSPAWAKGQKLAIELIIIQAKNSAGFKEEVPRKMKDFVEYCLRLDADPTVDGIDTTKLYSSELQTIVSKFQAVYRDAISKGPSLSVNFFHVALGDQIGDNLKIQAELLKGKVLAHFPTATTTYACVTGKELTKLHQTQPAETLPLRAVSKLDYTSLGCDSYVGIVKLRDFFDFISDEGRLREYIFEDNVRAHQGDVKVNKAIQDTLASPDGDADFWWLNNGITIIASKVTYQASALQISDPSIVNGLQTSFEVFNYYHRLGGDARNNDERTIMVKAIGTDNEQIAAKIINATNSQTRIDTVSLHATDKVQLDIEIALKQAGYFYDRRKNFYRNRGEPISKIVTMPYMAQALAAILLQEPDNARARPTTVAEKRYGDLFSPSYPLQLYVTCAKIMKRTDAFLEKQRIERGLKLNLVFHLAMYASSVVLTAQKPNYTKLASLDIELLTDTILQGCYKVTSEIFQRLGGDDKVAKGTEFASALKQALALAYPTKFRLRIDKRAGKALQTTA
jgi:hypothetical protein